MQDAKILRNLYIFRDLNQIQLAQFNKIMKVRKVDSGEVIIREGDEPNRIYVIERGRFEVSKGSGEHERVLAHLTEGQHFGEIGLIDKQPRSATVRAETDGELCVLTNDGVHRILDEFPDIRLSVYEKFLESLCERLRSANENLLVAAQVQGG